MKQILLTGLVLAFVVYRVCRFIRCTVQRERSCIVVLVYHHSFRRDRIRHGYCRLTVLPLIVGSHGEFRTCGIRFAILCYCVVYGRYRTVCSLLFTDADICIRSTIYLVNIQRHVIGFYSARNRSLYGFCRSLNRIEIALTDIRLLLCTIALRSTGYCQTGHCLRCTNCQRCRITVERNRRCRLGVTRYYAAVHRVVQVARYRIYCIAVLCSAFNIRPFSFRQVYLPLIICARKFLRSRSLHTESRRTVQRNSYVIRSVDDWTVHLIRQCFTDNDLAFNRFVLTVVRSGSNRILILFIRIEIIQLILILTARRFRCVYGINQYQWLLVALNIAVNLVILRRTVAGFPRQHHAVGGLLAQRQILCRRRRCLYITYNIAQHRHIISIELLIELHRPCAEFPVKVIARIAAAGNSAFLGNAVGIYRFRAGAYTPVTAAASLEAAYDTVYLHGTFVGILKVQGFTC